ncbi:DUF4097 family beta strand repeat-containing protein [Actinomadura atramentaria]|uniref:DUF4097 family beta strand repeat-containing protein n=1 Tax=Actinomadura atramentaria TaxID=1990 RepID=UPI00036EC48E|nr:DUF4097 family beta strand repeat-containing protein [Actinomadura atramentaria]
MSAGRPRRRGVWLALAALTGCAVVLPASAEAAGHLLRQTVEVPVAFDRPPREVRLDAGNARVSFGAARDGRARVHERLTWALRRPAVRMTWSGDVLWVKVECGHRERMTPGLSCSVALDFQVPAATAVTSTSAAGEVAVRGLTGPVVMRTRGGSLDLADTSGPVDFEAGSGNLLARGLRAARVKAHVGSGDVRMGFAGAPESVDARTGSGEIEVAVPPGSHYRLRGETGSGDRNIDQAVPDSNAPGVLDLSTGSGSVAVRYAAPDEGL